MTVVVGFIPGELGALALTAGIAEARLRGTRLVVVNTSRGVALVDDRYLGQGGLADLTQQLTDSGVDHEIRQSVGHDPADEIVEAAQDADADLIVLGLRRRSPVGKLIMGSVAQRVLLDSVCPVLTVKSPA